MKLRHIKRATQRRMFSPKACAWRALVQMGREVIAAGIEALEAYQRIPERLRTLIEAIDPEQMSPQAFRELVESMPGART